MIKYLAIAAVALVLFPFQSLAYSRAELGGHVVDKQESSGPSSINRIDLFINTQDGMYWLVSCTRAEGNLGWCSPVNEGEFIVVHGIVVDSGVIGCYGTVSPLSIQVIP